MSPTTQVQAINEDQGLRNQDGNQYVTYVQSQRIVSIIRSRFSKNVKRATHIWGQLFLINFFIRNRGKKVPNPGGKKISKKNRLLEKSIKKGFYVLKLNYVYIYVKINIF